MSNKHVQAAIDEVKRYREFFGGNDLEAEVAAACRAYAVSLRREEAEAFKKKRHERLSKRDQP